MKSSAALKIFFATCLIQLFSTQVYANTCVAVAGGTSGSPLLWKTAANWTNCGGVAPTAADDVQVGASTLYIEIEFSSLARSVDFTGFTGTLSFASGGASGSLSIGDGTAGLSNIALKFDAGMTVTAPTAAGGAVYFVSTSSTQQTVDFAGKDAGSVQFNGVGGRWALVSALNWSSTATLFLMAGTLDVDGISGDSGLSHTVGSFSIINATAKTLSMGNATVNLITTSSTAFNLNTGANLTVSANTGTVIMTNLTSFGAPTTDWNGMSVAWTGAGGIYAANGSTFKDFTVTGTAVKTNTFVLNSATPQITGALSLNGNSAINRVLVASATFGTSRGFNLSGASASMTVSNVDFRDIAITSSGGAPATPIDLSGISGGSGDCNGNSGITFTTAANQYWYQSTGNWSDATKWFLATGGTGGAGRVPLPQDDVFFDASSFSSASQTVTGDMPRAGKNINWTGATNTPAWSPSSNPTIYGGLTLISAMTLSTAGSYTLTFEGRGVYTLTSNTKSIPYSVTISMIGGTFRLADNANFSGTSTVTLNHGTFDAATNNVNVTVNQTFSSSNSNTRSILMGDGTWTFAYTIGTLLDLTTSTNLTLTPGNSQINITNTSNNGVAFYGGGKTFNNLTITGGGTGDVDFTGSNTFNTFTINSPKRVRFTAGTTTTFTSFVASGTASNSRVTISSLTSATHTLSQAAGTVNSDFLSLTRSVATGGATWYAGCNSLNVTGNSGWIFDCEGNFFQML